MERLKKSVRKGSKPQEKQQSVDTEPQFVIARDGLDILKSIIAKGIKMTPDDRNLAGRVLQQMQYHYFPPLEKLVEQCSQTTDPNEKRMHQLMQLMGEIKLTIAEYEDNWEVKKDGHPVVRGSVPYVHPAILKMKNQDKFLHLASTHDPTVLPGGNQSQHRTQNEYGKSKNKKTETCRN